MLQHEKRCLCALPRQLRRTSKLRDAVNRTVPAVPDAVVFHPRIKRTLAHAHHALGRRAERAVLPNLRKDQQQRFFIAFRPPHAHKHQHAAICIPLQLRYLGKNVNPSAPSHRAATSVSTAHRTFGAASQPPCVSIGKPPSVISRLQQPCAQSCCPLAPPFVWPRSPNGLSQAARQWLRAAPS